jgi:hypothetical protein
MGTVRAPSARAVVDVAISDAAIPNVNMIDPDSARIVVPPEEMNRDDPSRTTLFRRAGREVTVLPTLGVDVSGLRAGSRAPLGGDSSNLIDNVSLKQR